MDKSLKETLEKPNETIPRGISEGFPKAMHEGSPGENAKEISGESP